MIRRALPEEVELLTQLTWRSKAYWGYDEAFMQKAREVMRVYPEYIRDFDYFVLEADGVIVGYCSLESPDGDTITLENLFIDSNAIGSGYGKRLLNHAIETAKAMGYTTLIFEADPNAEPFYLRMGAERIGERESTIVPGRKLPTMRFNLVDSAQQS